LCPFPPDSYKSVTIASAIELEVRPMPGTDGSQYANHLAQIPIFGSCTADQLDRLADLSADRTSADGDEVVREGDKGGTFFVVASGRARVSRDGRAVGTLGAGDYFGELSLFDPAPRDATITADGPLTLVSLSRVAFMQALDEIPALRDALLQGMARRLHELDKRL
jgi:CRP/FNR family cyclic AMP-dependent transcriptional regulator